MCPVAVDFVATRGPELQTVLRRSSQWVAGCDLHPRRVREVANELVPPPIDPELRTHIRASAAPRPRPAPADRAALLLYPAAVRLMQTL
ncbi:hypothetical protein H4R21_000077 [Coemansia helicoidea]|uniref:Uncharacterized protein n=1 Tax=Coemansia helicoidea TaxID=1286919 RepID=A0ACC1LIN3_9FUNG|nr:hypothetical protein H4R21_000077 [Coemansia helicoidea]